VELRELFERYGWRYPISEYLISHAVRVSPQMSNRMIDACRSVLNRYIPDIYLYSDVYKGDESGK
jgi:RNA 3'-terminal phosphate cyclase